MEVTELQDAKAQLEAEIQEVLSRFMNETHLVVAGVDVKIFWKLGSEDGVYVGCTVKADVKLP